MTEIIALLIAFWYWTIRRGRLFVRAYVYLQSITMGSTPIEANYTAGMIGYMKASDYSAAAKMFAKIGFNGKQLAVIAAARELGFKDKVGY